MSKKTPPKICVVGSSNMDLISYTTHIPKQGATVLGTNFKMGFGGKGANQAVAAAKCGALVTMVTKLGDDVFGHQTFENYKNQNINCEYVTFTSNASSGAASIWVDETSGHNSIIVVSGANDILSVSDVDNAQNEIESSNILMCQNEIKLDVTFYALKMAAQKNVTTIFNPAPAPNEILDKSFFKYVDILCANETETQALTGVNAHTVDEYIEAGKLLLNQGVKKVLLTIGAQGSIWISTERIEFIAAQKVKAVDTTGAGDCFLGCFAYFYACGLDPVQAAHKASAAAAYSVQRHGTQTSYPSLNDFLPMKNF